MRQHSEGRAAARKKSPAKRYPSTITQRAFAMPRQNAMSE
jgi:hypothetical protein